MKIYKGDYYSSDDDYNQNEFNNNIEDNFKYFSSFHIHEGYRDSAFLYQSKDDAKNAAPYHNIIGVRISEYDLTEDQCKELLIKKELQARPNIVWYYSWNDSIKDLEFVKSVL